MFSIEAIPCLTALPLQARLGLFFFFCLSSSRPSSRLRGWGWFSLIQVRRCPGFVHSCPTRLQQGLFGDSVVLLPYLASKTAHGCSQGRVCFSSPKTNSPLPLKGEGLGIIFLGLLGLPCSFTTGSRWPNRAGLGLWWCRFPTLSPKLHTGPHRGEFGFTAFSWRALGLAESTSPAPACNSPPLGWARW